ncbi:MAG: YbfB/YjiJ family MFS transporter [Acidimicrobiales bacterium]
MASGSPSGPAVRRPLLIATGLALGPVVALGLARFAYSLLLPAMRADLHWTFAQAGAMSTANAVGYLAGAAAAGPLIAWRGNRWPYLGGLGLTGLTLLASGASANFEVLLALRLVAGATGAVVFIAGAGLVARLVAGLAPGRAAVLLGSYFAGAGLGIVVSALVVPPVVGLGAGGSWRSGWVILGGVSLVALAGAAPAALHAPEPTVSPGQGVLGRPLGRLAPALVAYGLFGAGYIAYVTFIVAFLKAEGRGPGSVTAFWAILGAAAVLGAFAWGPLLGRLRGGRGAAAGLGVVAVGALLPLVLPGPAGDFASAVVFGGAFLSVVTAVIDLARRSLSPAQVGPAIAVLTVAFGIGQSLGPVLAGVLSDGPGGVRAGLVLSVALLGAAVMVALLQPAAPAPVGRTPSELPGGLSG